MSLPTTTTKRRTVLLVNVLGMAARDLPPEVVHAALDVPVRICHPITDQPTYIRLGDLRPDHVRCWY